MSFTTMTFEDLKYTHENQKYNIPQTEDEDYVDDVEGSTWSSKVL